MTMASTPTHLRVRLGHAVRGSESSESSALSDALAVVAGQQPLVARFPQSEEAVARAEQILRVRQRPIYAFLGLLHPDLGTVGLIVSPEWTRRCVQGVSRCDTGGLAGRFGGFACVEDENLEEALLVTSFREDSLEEWAGAFVAEARNSYESAESAYVGGEVPDFTGWQDIRPRCIEHAQASGCLDRRLWTWEVRLIESPSPDEIECLVLSPEMRKRLEAVRLGGTGIPDSVRILVGTVGEGGIHWFEESVVHQAFLGLRI